MATTKVHHGPTCPGCGSDKINRIGSKCCCLDCYETWNDGEPEQAKRRSTGEFRGMNR